MVAYLAILKVFYTTYLFLRIYAMQEIVSKDDFTQKVLKSSKPVLVDFFAEWCGPCKKLAPLLEELSNQKKDQVDMYKLDVDKVGEMAEQYMVQSIPTLIIFKDGKEISKQIGGLSKADLKKWVESNIPN